MKEKSKTLSIFMHFKRKIERELQRRIKCLRTDNEGELTSKEFVDLREAWNKKTNVMSKNVAAKRSC